MSSFLESLKSVVNAVNRIESLFDYPLHFVALVQNSKADFSGMPLRHGVKIRSNGHDYIIGYNDLALVLANLPSSVTVTGEASFNVKDNVFQSKLRLATARLMKMRANAISEDKADTIEENTKTAKSAKSAKSAK